MDDPRFQQFFVDPQPTPQRRYEAIRAVILEGQPLPVAAARFGFAYGTLRNLVAQFRACIRLGRTPPFSLRCHAGGPPTKQRNRAPTDLPSPIAGCSLSTAIARSARASPGSSCFCPYSLSSAWIAWFATQDIPARA
jgi:hypothetical protein